MRLMKTKRLRLKEDCDEENWTQRSSRQARQMKRMLTKEMQTDR